MTAAVADAQAVGQAVAPIHGPLVSTSISQQPRLEVYKKPLSVKRPGTGNPDQVPPDRSGSWIGSFSDKSKSRLRFLTQAAFPDLVSQFGLTYHDQWPTDGRTSKAHLNAWLVALRRIVPGVRYLWLLEFQKRNAPHYHVFLTIPPDAKKWNLLAEAWTRITGGSDDQLWWHGRKRGKNWIAWDMGTGSYLCKYLDKEAQKAIPEGYHSFGRFWGNSRGLKPKIDIPLSDVDRACSVIDQDTGEIYGGATTVIRWLGRLAEKQTRGYSRFRTRAQHGSYTMLNGASAYKQIEGYFYNLQEGKKHD